MEMARCGCAGMIALSAPKKNHLRHEYPTPAQCGMVLNGLPRAPASNVALVTEYAKRISTKRLRVSIVEIPLLGTLRQIHWPTHCNRCQELAFDPSRLHPQWKNSEGRHAKSMNSPIRDTQAVRQDRRLKRNTRGREYPVARMVAVHPCRRVRHTACVISPSGS